MTLVDITTYESGLNEELGFWDYFFSTALTDSSHYFHTYLSKRLDSKLLFHSLPHALLPEGLDTYKILDVGSGPLPFLGRVIPNKTVHIIAVDKLANEYLMLYKKHKIYPPIIPIECSAEGLSELFPISHFDLVYARNSIDHTQNPLACIREMMEVSGGRVLLEHRRNEGLRENYIGLHQWNFDCVDGRFIIRNRNWDAICVNDVFPDWKVECYITNEEEENTDDWLVVSFTSQNT